MDLVILPTEGALGGHIAPLELGDSLAIDLGIGVLAMPEHIGGIVDHEGDATIGAVAGDRNRPNVAGDISDSSHNNLRPFKGF